MTDSVAVGVLDRQQVASLSDIAAIERSLHGLEVRVAVLEARLSAQEEQLKEIKQDIDEGRADVKEVLTKLTEHVDRESRSKNRLLTLIVVTLLSVIGTALFPKIDYQGLLGLFSG